MDVPTGESEAAPEEMPTFHKALLRPVAWCVECPVCGAEIEISEVSDDNYGAWCAQGTDQFPECEACGALVEAVAVTVSEAYPADPT